MINKNQDIVSYSLVKCLESYGKCKNFAFKDFGNFVAFNSVIESASCNYVWSIKEDANIEFINKMEGFFKTLPFSLFISANHLIEKDFLCSHNFKFTGSVLGMKLDLSNLIIPINHAVNVKQVVSDDDMKIWLKIVSSGFSIEQIILEKLVTPIYKELNNQFFYIAYLDQEPVSGCNISIFGDIAYVSWVTTIPEKRRKGVGAILVANSLKDAKRRGCKIATLGSSKMAENVYRNVGFCDDYSYFSFVR